MSTDAPPVYSIAMRDRSDPVFFVYVKGGPPTSAPGKSTGATRSASTAAANQFEPGEDIDLSSRVTAIEYEDDEKKTDLLKVTIDNSDLYFFSAGYGKLKKGGTIIASWGYAHAMTPVRQCVIQKVTGSRSITIEAQDAGVLMQKISRTRTFDGMTRSQIVAQIATENGYGPDLQQIKETTEVIPTVVQASQPDGPFLKRLADIEGFEYFVDFDGLHWHPRNTAQAPIRRLTYFLPPGVGDFEDFTFEADVAGKPAAVTTAGINPITKQPVTATADQSTVARTTTAATPEVAPPPPAPPPAVKVDPVTGLETTVYPAPPKNSAGADPNSSATTKPTTATTNTAAQSEASGAFIRTQQATGSVTIPKMIGDPSIVAKSIIQIDGIGSAIEGRYYVANVKTSMGSGGYTIALKCKTDGHNGAANGSAKNAAKPNTKDAPATSDAASPAPMPPAVKVDPASGREVTVYQQTGGREGTPK